MNDYQYGHTLIAPEDIEDSGVSSDMARRWQTLQHLQVKLLALPRGMLTHVKNMSLEVAPQCVRCCEGDHRAVH